MSSDFADGLTTHLPNLRAFARSLAQNSAQADDLVQETVLKAWSNRDKFEQGTNLRAWLFTILRNTHYSQMRKRKREVEDADGSMVASLSQAPSQMDTLNLRDFEEAFIQLPVDQREALVLVGASGFSYDEAAEICGCATGTVKSRVNRARRRLVEMLSLDEDEAFQSDAISSAVISAAAVGQG